MHTAFHAAGCTCLIAMFVTAIWAMVEVVAPRWRRILSLAAGNVEPAFEPISQRPFGTREWTA